MSPFRRAVGLLCLGLSLATPQAADATPPPPPGNAVNCAAPVYAVDRLVCDDADLRATDARLADLWARAEGAPAAAWIEGQDAWFRRRALCAFAKDGTPCLREAYAERRTVLTALSATPGPQAIPARCKGAPWPGPTRLDPRAHSALVFDGEDQLQAVAVEDAPASSWSPFVAYRPGKPDVRHSQGVGLRCAP